MTTIAKILRLREIRRMQLNISARAVKQSNRLVKLGKEAESIRKSIPKAERELYAEKLKNL